MGHLEFQFLGSGDAFGSGGRFQTCFRIQWERGTFLIDCGATSLTAMRRFGVDPSLIDLILISHLHGDHFGGIPFLVLEAQFSRRMRPLTVVGPEGVEGRVAESMEVLFPGSSRVQRKFSTEFVEFHDRKEITIGPMAITPHAVVHPSGAASYALRVDLGGKVVAYSGDTEWTEALVEVARGADLFVCEAYSFEKKIKYHLDYKTILEYRSQLGCRRLFLTHMNQEMMARLTDLRIEWAEDGKRIEV